MPETVGQELVAVVQQGQAAAWFAQDVDDPAYVTSNIHHAPAIDMERRIAAGIGAIRPSRYCRLFVGGTVADAPLDPDVIHVNCLTEDMRFKAAGPRILTDGSNIPLPDSFFQKSEGYHIPFDLQLTPALVQELYRTLQSKGWLVYAPSHSVPSVVALLTQAGFTSVTINGPAPRTYYRGRPMLPTLVITAMRP